MIIKMVGLFSERTFYGDVLLLNLKKIYLLMDANDNINIFEN